MENRIEALFENIIIDGYVMCPKYSYLLMTKDESYCHVHPDEEDLMALCQS